MVQHSDAWKELEVLGQASEGGGGAGGVRGQRWLDAEMGPLPPPSPGTPFFSWWPAGPSGTLGAALLDGAVAPVSERSLRASSADGPRRRIIVQLTSAVSVWQLGARPLPRHLPRQPGGCSERDRIAS